MAINKYKRGGGNGKTKKSQPGQGKAALAGKR